MLRDMAAYDRALEAFSGPISSFIDYNLDSQQQLTLLSETADLYRFFDARGQAEYLFDCIEDTIGCDLKRELDFLKFFDAGMKDVMDIVDIAQSAGGPASHADSPVQRRFIQDQTRLVFGD